MKKFDGSIEMMQDVMEIDKHSFQDIDATAKVLCKRLEENKNYELFVKYQDGKALAYLGLLYVANLHYDGCWIDLIAVHEEHRNQGIGQELVAFAEKQAKEKGKAMISGLIHKENISSLSMVKAKDFHHDDKGFFLCLKSL